METKKKRLRSDSLADKKDTDMALEENKCPYCDFQCRRASALKFHIDFNHKGEKKSSDKRKAEETVDNRQVKKSKLVQITVDSPVTNSVNNSVTNKLQMKKLDDRTGKASNKPIESDERKDSSQETKDRTSRKHDVENDQPERVFIISKKGMQETEKKKMPSVQRKTQNASIEKSDIAKNEFKCKKFLRATNSRTDEEVLLEDDDESDGEDDEIADEGDEDDDYLKKNTKINSDAENVSYICPVCSREFKWLAAAKQHIKSMHPSEKLRDCDIISLIPKFTTSTNKARVRANEKENKVSGNTKPASTLSFTCPFCKMSAGQMKDIKVHIEAVHKNRDIQKVCNKNNVVSEHAMTKDTVEIKMCNKNTASRVHKCPFCSLSFKLKHDVTTHVRNFHENKGDMLQTCDTVQVGHETPEQKGTSGHRHLKSQVCSSHAVAKKKADSKSIELEGSNVTIIYADENGDFKDMSALDNDSKQNELHVDSEKTGHDQYTSKVNEEEQGGDTKLERRGQDKLKSKPFLSLVLRKPVFGVSDQVRHKPCCAVTENA